MNLSEKKMKKKKLEKKMACVSVFRIFSWRLRNLARHSLAGLFVFVGWLVNVGAAKLRCIALCSP